MNAPDPLHSTRNTCFGAFRTVLLLHESRYKTGWTIAINAKLALRSCVGIFRNERTRSTQLDPKLMFRTISLLHESRCKTGRTGAINAQVRLTNLRRNFSQRMRLFLYIWPKTHVLGRFRPFRYYTKVDTNLAELALLTPKFAKWSLMRTSPLTIHPHLHQYLLQQHLLILLLALVLVGLPIK
jgi:hypothetical protein